MKTVIQAIPTSEFGQVKSLVSRIGTEITISEAKEVAEKDLSVPEKSIFSRLLWEADIIEKAIRQSVTAGFPLVTGDFISIFDGEFQYEVKSRKIILSRSKDALIVRFDLEYIEPV